MTDVVLLCSEITRGMKSYGPKATILLGKRKEPLIVKQIKLALKLYKQCTIYIVVGFGYQKIQKIISDYGLDDRVQFIFHSEYEHHNNGGAFLCGLEYCKRDTIIINNGVILNEHISHTECCLPIINSKNIDDFPIGSIIDADRVQHLFFDLDNRWSEVLFIPSRQIGLIKNLVLDQKEKLRRMFLFEVLNHLIDSGLSLSTQTVHHNKLQKITSHKNS